MILSVSHLSKSYGTDEIITDISFHLEEKEKAAIIGPNGAGKSTILKIIAGELSASSGDVIVGNKFSVGYLSQHQEETLTGTIYDCVYSAKPEIVQMEKRLAELETIMHENEQQEGSPIIKEYDEIRERFARVNGYSYKSEVVGVLKGLGFAEEDFNKEAKVLSGGQKTRLALSRLLIRKPDLLMLDEPINHLDLNSVAFLESFLQSFPGAVLMVAHDRYFLDKTVTKIIELSHHKGTMYLGNYTEYKKKRDIVKTSEQKAFEKQQKEIAHHEEVIKKLQQFNREKSIKRAESRKKILDKIDRLDAPLADEGNMKLRLSADRESGKDVLTIENFSKSFGSLDLFKDVNFEVKRGQKVAIIGDNGTGKTTLLKMITGEVPRGDGVMRLGMNVDVGYYDQEHQVLDHSKTVFDEIHDEYPDLDNTKIRNVLGAFLFRGDDVFKLVGDLSGGERGRVSLAKLMLSGSNFLILDEPTNHLDMGAKEVLEDALKAFDGTLLFVSHDRYFINQVADHVIDLRNGGIRIYNGNYDDYLDNFAKRKDLIDDVKVDIEKPKTSENKLSWEEQKALNAKKAKLKRDLDKIEKSIEETEDKKAKLEADLWDEKNATNSVKLQEIQSGIDECENKLLELMEEWEKLSLEAEE